MVSDAELIRRIVAGDPLAERALYDRHIENVYRVAFRLCADSDVAGDYAQETFIKAFRNLGQFRGDSTFGTWIRSVVLSVAITGERKRSRFQDGADLDAVPDERAEREHSATELVARVSSALDRLSEKLRTVFLLHDVEGYTHEEIADALGIPPGTSRARLSEARAKLRVALSDYRKEEAS